MPSPSIVCLQAMVMPVPVCVCKAGVPAPCVSPTPTPKPHSSCRRQWGLGHTSLGAAALKSDFEDFAQDHDPACVGRGGRRHLATFHHTESFLHSFIEQILVHRHHGVGQVPGWAWGCGQEARTKLTLPCPPGTGQCPGTAPTLHLPSPAARQPSE